MSDLTLEKLILREAAPDETWATDFVHDQRAAGLKLRAPTVVDTFPRFALAADPRVRRCAEDVVAALDRACAEVSLPRTIRVDQGREFVSRDLELQACRQGVALDFPRPGRPIDGAFIEAFNGRLRPERLNTHRFHSLADARDKSEACRGRRDEERPHGAIGGKVRITLTNLGGASGRLSGRSPETPAPGGPRFGCSSCFTPS